MSYRLGDVDTMETLIIFLLVVINLIISTTLQMQTQHIKRLSKVLNKMDIAIEQQHKVLHNQQEFIDNIVDRTGGNFQFPNDIY